MQAVACIVHLWTSPIILRKRSQLLHERQRNGLMRMAPEIAIRMYFFMLFNCLYNETVGSSDYIFFSPLFIP